MSEPLVSDGWVRYEKKLVAMMPCPDLTELLHYNNEAKKKACPHIRKEVFERADGMTRTYCHNCRNYI